MTAVAERQARGDGVAVVERAVLVQQLVAGAETPLSLRELARRADLPPTTTKRLAQTLEGLALVERDSRGRYVVGASASTLIGPAEGRRPSSHTLDIVAKRVVDRFDESATITVDAGSEALYSGCRVSSQDVQVPDVTGETSPFHLIASGVILMSAWSEDRLGRYLDGDLVAATPMSTTDPDTLRERIQAARANGFAWSVGESLADITAVAVPVYNSEGEVIASIGVYGPTFRLDPDDRALPKELADLVNSTARSLGL